MPMDAAGPHLTKDEVAARAGVAPGDVEVMARLDLLQGEGDRFDLGDVDRVRLVHAFVQAGVSVESLAEATTAGSITFAHYPDLHPDRGDIATRTYASLRVEMGDRGVDLSSLFASFGLTEPAGSTRLPVAGERLLEALAGVAQEAERDLVLRAVRLLGEAARRATEGLMSVFDEASHHVDGAPRVPSGEAYERLLEPWARLGRLVPDLASFLAAEHLSRAIDAYSVEQTERILGELGIVQPRVEAPPAVAFLDLSGFTRLAQERGDQEAARVALRLGEIAELVSRRNGGRLVKLLGDGVLMVFNDVGAAVTTCLEVLDTLPDEGLPDGHAGINAGPLLRRDGDVFGRTVNTAARVSDVTPAGELYLTEAAAAIVDSEPLEPVGVVDLKSIGPTTLLRVVRR
jgi:adenylate cyclase